MPLRQAGQGAEQPPVIDGGPVHIGDHRAFSRGAHLPVVVHPGQIGGGGGLQHQGDVRLHGESRSKGPPGAHLLLSGEGEGHVHGQLLPQQGEHDGAANSVVDGLGLQHPLPQLLRLTQEGAVSSGPDQSQGLVLVGSSDVQIHAVRLGDLLALLPADQVDGLQADDPGDLFRAQHHRLADGHPAVHPAHKVELAKALVGDAGDDQAHLVHVGCQQQLGPVGPAALFEHDQVAQGVGADGVGIGPGLFPQKVPDSVLVPGHAVLAAELFEQINHCRAPPLPIPG